MKIQGLITGTSWPRAAADVKEGTPDLVLDARFEILGGAALPQRLLEAAEQAIAAELEPWRFLPRIPLFGGERVAMLGDYTVIGPRAPVPAWLRLGLWVEHTRLWLQRLADRPRGRALLAAFERRR